MLRHRIAGLLAAVLLVGAGSVPAIGGTKPRQPVRSFAPAKEVNYREPARAYVVTNAFGWTVQLEDELATNQSVLCRKAVGRLERKLAALAGSLPASSHARLRRLPIFLMLGEEAADGGRDNGAEYFQRHAPDHYPLMDPRWGSSLVIYSARNYLQLSEEWALRLLIHEFAHAWQLEQWPEDQPDILGAFQQAMDKGLYRDVRDVNGDPVAKAYAAQNQLEYFAELSCTYFLRGEYEPFDRVELRRYDPKGLSMIEKMWGLHSSPPAASRP